MEGAMVVAWDGYTYVQCTVQTMYTHRVCVYVMLYSFCAQYTSYYFIMQVRTAIVLMELFVW